MQLLDLDTVAVLVAEKVVVAIYRKIISMWSVRATESGVMYNSQETMYFQHICMW